MSCYHPLRGWRSREPTANGKFAITFVYRKGWTDLPISVPCGKCVGCRMDNARDWSARCVHEASMFRDNCVITLTYDGGSLPEHGSLVVSDFQKFMKRLRKRFPGVGIRFFHCGEYGEKLGRPHYHAILFNFDFPDKVFYALSKSGSRLYRSKILEELWTKGFSNVGDFNAESAAYIARYVTKKEGGKSKDLHYGLKVPEYVTMSRRPGIGFNWLMRFGSTDVYPNDYIVLNGGLKCKPSRFYDEKFFLDKKSDFGIILANRIKAAKVSPDNTDSRLLARERVHKAKVGLYGRSYEASGI